MKQSESKTDQTRRYLKTTKIDECALKYTVYFKNLKSLWNQLDVLKLNSIHILLSKLVDRGNFMTWKLCI